MATGLCRELAPDVFGSDDQGWVSLLDAAPGDKRYDAVQDAADGCPVAAIEVG